MDEHRFDQLTRSLARGRSRRGLLKGLAGVIGGALGLGAASTGDARTRAPNGTPCSSPRDCATALCVDGYCCDTACIGTCEACNLGGSEGVCSPVEGAPVGNRGPCPGDGGVCSGQCDGVTTTQCAGYPAGETICGETTCANGTATGHVCSGNGLCIQSTTHCGLYTCAPDGSGCLSNCTSDDECLGEAFCAGGICQGDLSLGSVCDRIDQCQSGHCVDGVCCDTACDGECQTCGADGFCAESLEGDACDGGFCCLGECRDWERDLANCGGCGIHCPGADNAEPVCINGECTIACHPGFKLCDDACIPATACCTADDCTQPTGDNPCQGAARCDDFTCGFDPAPIDTPCRSASCLDGVATEAADCDGFTTNCPAIVTETCLSEACDGDSCAPCIPECGSGQACGDSDGCDGTCAGPCPDPGPCSSNVCDEVSHTCIITNQPANTDCSDQCTFGAYCNDSGVCTGGFTRPPCTQTSDACFEQAGECDPDIGCVFTQLSEGTVCGSQGDFCNPYRCTADGSCQSDPVTCDDSECQACNPTSGACQAIREHEVCGGGQKFCTGGACESPCGEDCVDWCYATLDTSQQPEGYFCCPEEARMPGGLCCWVGGQAGVITNDGHCTSPNKMCDDGNFCEAECCGGVCPSDTQYCDNETLVSTTVVCTLDSDCVSAGFSAGVICAGVDYSFGENGPFPIPNSGTCCPVGYSGFVQIGAGGPDYFCCTPGTKIAHNASRAMCCSYPAYASSGCFDCTCSFRNISRCCA